MIVVRKLLKFFDKLEDKVRAHLSHYPIVYSLIGGVGIVMFWRGVWHTADQFTFLTGPVSIALSLPLLLISGLFVSFFVADRVFLSGIKREEKLIQKTENEIREEENMLRNVAEKIKEIDDEVHEIQHKMNIKSETTHN